MKQEKDMTEQFEQAKRVDCTKCEWWKIGYGHCSWCINRKPMRSDAYENNYKERVECSYYEMEGRCIMGCGTDTCIHHPNNR